MTSCWIQDKKTLTFNSEDREIDIISVQAYSENEIINQMTMNKSQI